MAAADSKKEPEKEPEKVIVKEKKGKKVVLKEKKPKQFFLHALAIAVSIIIVILIVFLSATAEKQKVFFLDLGTANDTSGKFFLEPKMVPDMVSTNYTVGEATFRELVSTKQAYFRIVSPADANNSLIVKLRFKSDSELKVGTTDKNKTNAKSAYLPKMHNFVLAQEVGDVGVYAAKNKKFEYSTKLVDWLEKNAWQGAKISSIDYSLPKNLSFAKIDECKGNIDLNGTFYSPLTVYTYAKKDLNINIVSQELNKRIGKDDLNVSIFDLFDNQIGEQIIPDDGIDNNSGTKTDPVSTNIAIAGLKEAPYKIAITAASTDIQITKLKINSCKMVLDKNFFVVSPTTFYFNNAKQGKISFSTTSKSAFQKVSVKGDKSFEQNVNETGKVFEKTIDASKDYYSLIIPNGNIKIASNNLFAPTKEALFEPFSYAIVPFDQNPDFVITTGKTSISSSGGWVESELIIDKKDIIKTGNDIILAVSKTDSSKKVQLDSITVTVN